MADEIMELFCINEFMYIVNKSSWYLQIYCPTCYICDQLNKTSQIYSSNQAPTIYREKKLPLFSIVQLKSSTNNIQGKFLLSRRCRKCRRPRAWSWPSGTSSWLLLTGVEHHQQGVTPGRHRGASPWPNVESSYDGAVSTAGGDGTRRAGVVYLASRSTPAAM